MAFDVKSTDDIRSGLISQAVSVLLMAQACAPVNGPYLAGWLGSIRATALLNGIPLGDTPPDEYGRMEVGLWTSVQQALYIPSAVVLLNGALAVLRE